MNRQESREELEMRIRQYERRHMCLIASDRPEAKRFVRAVQAGKLLQPMPRLFVRPEYWDVLDTADRVMHCMRSLQALHPAWVFVGPSAALVLSLEIPLTEEFLWPIRIAARWGSRGRSTPQVLRQVVEGDDVTVVDHLRVTSLERTAFDCMREMSFEDGLAIADSVLAISGQTRSNMIKSMNGFRRTSRGGRHAMEAAAYADGGARNGDESRLRAAIIRQGFEIPGTRVAVTLPDGTNMRAPLGWHNEDGTWTLLRFNSSRKRDVAEEEYEGVRLSIVTREILEDPEALTTVLSNLGVPKAKEAPNIGQAKAFAPARPDAE